jgi:hypothetical protein
MKDLNDKITWIVAAVVIAIALIYGWFVQYVLFWTILLAIIVMSGVLTAMYCLNRHVERG